jgi:general secretion pathway protein A
MYESYFGLRERPFDLGSNLRFLYLPEAHREALDTLNYAISSRKGVTVLTGESGCGKTTMIRAAIAAQDGRQTTCVNLVNPRLTRDEFFAFLTKILALPVAKSPTKTECLAALEQRLEEYDRDGHQCVLIVDEAQSISDDVVEEIRLLTNMQPTELPVLLIIMAGQPEFADRLDSPTFRHLKQRVALRCHLPALTSAETANYIANRIRVAGGSPKHVFSREAVELIHSVSGGIPRVISVLCDNALVSGFGSNERPVGSARVEEVCNDFRFGHTTSIGQPAPAATPEPPTEPTPGSRFVFVPDSAATASARPIPPAGGVEADRPLMAADGARRRFGFWRSR